MNLKLNINSFFFNINCKKNYKKTVNNKTKLIKKNLFLKNSSNIDYFFVKFVLFITTKKSNIFIHVLDCLGNEKFFYSKNSRFDKFSQTYNKLENFYKILITKFKFLKKKPLAVYFNNTQLNYRWFLNKIFKKFFIINVKFFNKYSHNGCKKKKL